MSKFLDDTGLGHLIDKIKSALSGKQATLVSGTNIKTINSSSLLSSGNINVVATDDGITPSSGTITRFATCSTGASTVAKTASLTSGTISSLSNGTRVTVYFSNKNTANSPTLNISSKGAYNIYYNGSQITSGTNKGLLYGMVDFVYYSSRWNIVGFTEVGNTAQATLVSGTNIKTVNSTSLLGSGNVAVQPTLVSGTNIKTVNSTSLLGSGNVAVQETLVSGTNIKTINNESILGSGNITIQGGGGGGITGTGVTAIVALTESEYAALSSKSSTTLYIVTPDTNNGGGIGGGSND